MERARSCHARESPVPPTGGGIETSAALPYRGGSGDMRGGASSPSTPTDRRTRLDSSLSLTLGPGTISLVAAKRRRRDGAGAENNCKEDCEDLRHRRPQGRLQVAREGFSPSGFPPSRSGHCPTCIYSHTHRRWGRIGGRGSAADRGRRGDSLSQSLWVRVRIREPCAEDALRYPI